MTARSDTPAARRIVAAEWRRSWKRRGYCFEIAARPLKGLAAENDARLIAAGRPPSPSATSKRVVYENHRAIL